MINDKKYERPELIVIFFEDDSSIITASGDEPTDIGGDNLWSDLY